MVMLSRLVARICYSQDALAIRQRSQVFLVEGYGLDAWIAHRA